MPAGERRADVSVMADTFAPAARRAHPVLPDTTRGHMAKAPVRIPDAAWGERLGSAVARAIAMVGWSHKEASARIGVDDAEFGKWMSGARRPQFDKLWAHKALRLPLVLALARLANAEVVTEIRFREMA